MDYQNIYDDFIADRRMHPTGDIRAELHHIIPISAGGTNDESNIIRLSIRDHIFAHKVLRRLGLSPVATNKMSRAVAAKILAGYSDEIGFNGRGPGKNPAKIINAILSREGGTTLRGLSDMLADRLVEMLSKDPGLAGYKVGFRKSQKFHKFFNREVFTKMKDFVTISKDAPSETKSPAKGETREPEPAEKRAYVFTDGDSGNPLSVPCNPRGNAGKGWAAVKLREEVYRRLDAGVKASLDANGGRLSQDAPRICYSNAEYYAMRKLAFIGGFAAHTKYLPGQYSLSVLCVTVWAFMVSLLEQNALLEHVDDGGYRDFNIGPDIEDPGQRLLEMQLAILAGDEYARMYSGIVHGVMEDAVKHFAGPYEKRKWLYQSATQIAERYPGELKAYLADEAKKRSSEGKMMDVPREIHEYLVRKCLKAIRTVFSNQPGFQPVA